jgi:hypothetical protein
MIMMAGLNIAMGRLASVTAPPDITDLPDLYRHINPERFLELLDSLMDDASQPVLSRDQFCIMQRKRLLKVREYLQRLNHNAILVFQIAWEAKLREENQPAEQRNPRNLQCFQELVYASFDLGWYARAGLLRIKFWLLVRTHPWSPLPPPRLADLKKIKKFDFVSGYSRYKEAVGNYGLIYSREFREALMLLL